MYNFNLDISADILYQEIYLNDIFPCLLYIPFEDLQKYTEKLFSYHEDFITQIALFFPQILNCTPENQNCYIYDFFNELSTHEQSNQLAFIEYFSKTITKLSNAEHRFRKHIEKYPTITSKLQFDTTTEHDELLFRIEYLYLNTLPLITKMYLIIRENKINVNRIYKNSSTKEIFNFSYKVSVDQNKIDTILTEQHSNSLYWAQPVPINISFTTLNQDHEERYTIHLPVLYLNYLSLKSKLNLKQVPMHTIQKKPITLDELNIQEHLPNAERINELMAHWQKSNSKKITETEKYRDLREFLFSSLFKSSDELTKNELHRDIRSALDNFISSFSITEKKSTKNPSEDYLKNDLSKYTEDLKAFYIYRAYLIWKTDNGNSSKYIKFHTKPQADKINYLTEYLFSPIKSKKNVTFTALSNTSQVYTESPTIYDELVALLLVNLNVAPNDLMLLLSCRISRDEKQQYLYRILGHLRIDQEIEWFKRILFSKYPLYMNPYERECPIPKSTLFIAKLYLYQCIFQEALQEDVMRTLTEEWKKTTPLSEENLDFLVKITKDYPYQILIWLNKESKNLELEGSQLEKILKTTIPKEVSKELPSEVKEQILTIIFNGAPKKISSNLAQALPLIPIIKTESQDNITKQELSVWLYSVLIALHIHSQYLTNPTSTTTKFNIVRYILDPNRKATPDKIIKSQHYYDIPSLLTMTKRDKMPHKPYLPVFYQYYYDWLYDYAPYQVKVENIWSQSWYLPEIIYSLNGFTRCAIYQTTALILLKFYEKMIPRFFDFTSKDFPEKRPPFWKTIDFYLDNFRPWIEDYKEYLTKLENK